MINTPDVIVNVKCSACPVRGLVRPVKEEPAMTTLTPARKSFRCDSCPGWHDGVLVPNPTDEPASVLLYAVACPIRDLVTLVREDVTTVPATPATDPSAWNYYVETVSGYAGVVTYALTLPAVEDWAGNHGTSIDTLPWEHDESDDSYFVRSDETMDDESIVTYYLVATPKIKFAVRDGAMTEITEDNEN